MLTISIQAGGESRRMGQDKALLPFIGQPLIQRLVTRLRPIANEIIISANKPEAFGFLGLPLFPDEIPRGALGGLYTAIKKASHPFVAVIACDMPFANPTLLEYQLRLLQDGNDDIAIPINAAGYEPLHAVYRRETCLPAIERALDHDQWKIISWFPNVNVRTLLPEECRIYDPQALAFWNVNTPQEFSEAEIIARKENGRV